MPDVDTEGYTQLAVQPDPAAEAGKLVVQFYKHPTPDPVETEKQGRPIFKETVYVRIYIPGDRNNVIDRPAWDQDFHRYPRHWEAYQKGKGEEMVGTPLAAWPSIDRNMVEELKYFKCYTVENLAGMNDDAIQKWPGIRAYQQKARDFLIAAKDNSFATSLRAEVTKKDDEIEMLRKALHDQGERLKKIESNRR